MTARTQWLPQLPQPPPPDLRPSIPSSSVEKDEPQPQDLTALGFSILNPPLRVVWEGVVWVSSSRNAIWVSSLIVRSPLVEVQGIRGIVIRDSWDRAPCSWFVGRGSWVVIRGIVIRDS